MSTKTVAEKIFLRQGKRVFFFNAPDNLGKLLGGIPEGVIATEDDTVDIVLAFIENYKQLEKHLIGLKDRLKPKGALWIAYHKGTSSIDTDINRDSIIEFAMKHQLKGVAMVSINDNWSALRLKIIH
ncbi:DUF3052 domain-containing protein [Balneolaceae bacterium YR4-1]|uniref:DUF3052 domain-containing protein n=1 Tax=Halalkalibaculum roseum TaxID=2709311 RepID=A0A6M1STF6_9BACT|nr:DUF3052 domain-containing protein [Halalkalibaculum roseum]NGP75398.1 DUF3052 domain-containing protein [Halalkalibaculum roseum]